MVHSRLLLVPLTALLALLASFCGPHTKPGRAPRPVPTPSPEVFPLRPVARIPGGTVIGDGVPEGWTDLVLLVQPRLGAGDVSALPEAAGHYARLFQLTILARVRANRAPEGIRYILDRVAVGYAVDVGERKVVVTDATASRAGLDFIARHVLAKNEQMLGELAEVGRSATAVLFDAPALVLRGGEHRSLIYRHLIWVRPSDGRVTALVWLLEPSKTGDHTPVDEAVLLPPGLREDRVLSVKKEKITFGLPGPDALALVGLPREGRRIPFTPALREAVGRRRYSPATLAQLEAVVDAAVRD